MAGSKNREDIVPARYKDPMLQRQFAASLLNPPVRHDRGRLRRTNASGWYEAFWRGYDGVDEIPAKGASGTRRRAIWMAGRERRRLEQKGALPVCDPDAPGFDPAVAMDAPASSRANTTSTAQARAMTDEKVDPRRLSDNDFQILNEAMQRLFGVVDETSDTLTDVEWDRAREIMQAFEREATVRDAVNFPHLAADDFLTPAERRALAEGLVEHADGGFEAFDWEAENFDPGVIRSCIEKGVLEDTGYKGLVRGTERGKAVFYKTAGPSASKDAPSMGPSQ